MQSRVAVSMGELSWRISYIKLDVHCPSEDEVFQDLLWLHRILFVTHSIESSGEAECDVKRGDQLSYLVRPSAGLTVSARSLASKGIRLMQCHVDLQSMAFDKLAELDRAGTLRWRCCLHQSRRAVAFARHRAVAAEAVRRVPSARRLPC